VSEHSGRDSGSDGGVDESDDGSDGCGAAPRPKPKAMKAAAEPKAMKAAKEPKAMKAAKEPTAMKAAKEPKAVKVMATPKAMKVDWSDLATWSRDDTHRTIGAYTSRAYHGAKGRAIRAGLTSEQSIDVAKAAYAAAKKTYTRHMG